MLQHKLRGAVETLLTGKLSPDEFLEALDYEVAAVESTQDGAPQGDLGSAMVEALDLYLDCLVQVEELMLAGAEFDHHSLQPVYQQASEADAWLDELTELEPSAFEAGLEI